MNITCYTILEIVKIVPHLVAFLFCFCLMSNYVAILEYSNLRRKSSRLIVLVTSLNWSFFILRQNWSFSLRTIQNRYMRGSSKIYVDRLVFY